MKNKYLIILIAFFILIIYPYFSEGLEVWVIDGDNISFENEFFKVSVSEQGDAVILKSNNTERMQVVLKLNVSVENQGINYLFSERKNINEDYYTQHNISGVHDGSEDESQYKINIEKPVPDISIIRSTPDQKLTPMEIFNYTIIIENSGDLEITGDYQEKLPIYLKKISRLIYKRTDAEQREYWGFTNPDEINWRGVIKPGEEINLIQEMQLVGSIIGNDNIIFNQGQLTYEYLGNNFIVESEELSPVYDYPLKASMEFKDNNVMIDQENNLKITLNNEAEEGITVQTMKVYLSDKIAIMDTDLVKADDHYEWDGKIDGLKSEEFQLGFVPINTGNISIVATIDSKYRTVTRNIEIKDNIIAEINLPTVELETPVNVDGNQEVEVSFLIDNENTDYDFYDVGINISSDLFDNIHYIFTSINKGATVSKSFSFKSPWVDSKMYFPVNLTLSYKSIHKELFNLTQDKKIQINRVEFVPDLDMIQIESELKESDNSSYFNNLTLFMNLTHLTNDTIDYVKIKLGLLERNYYIIPTQEKLTENNSQHVKEIKVLKNLSKTSISVPVYIKYSKGDDVYFLEKNFNIDISKNDEIIEEKEQPKPSVNEPIITEEIPEEGFQWGVNLRMMIISSVVILFVFFIIVIATFVSKKKKKVDHSHDQFFLNIEKVKVKEKKAKGALIKEKKQKTKKQLEPSEPVSIPPPTTELQLLEDYISDCAMRGVPKDKIKQNLINSGWLEDVIEVFLK